MTPAQHARGVRILHRVFAVEGGALIAVFILLLRLRPPLLTAAAPRAAVAYALSGFGAVAVLIALAVLRPMARDRLHAAPRDAPWNAVTRSATILTWFAATAGTVLGAIGLVLTGFVVPAAVAAFGFVVMLWSSPGRLSAP